MNRYRVTCRHRMDDGMNYDFPTHTSIVTVEAADVNEARMVAIDEVYRRNPTASHVYPGAVNGVNSNE